MYTTLKAILAAGVLAVVCLGTPASAKADHNRYWRNHWGWYDNTYRPYYNNYYGRNYGGYYAPNYGGYYSRPYYGGYYGGGGYYAPGVGIGVRIGNRASFGWW